MHKRPSIVERCSLSIRNNELEFPMAPAADPATEDARTKLNAATPMMQKQRISINATEATTESATPTPTRTALPN